MSSPSSKRPLSPSSSQSHSPEPTSSKKRKIASPPPPPPKPFEKSGDLSQWLGLPPPPPLPEPFVTSKPVYDKDSIFIAYALPLPGTGDVSRKAVEGLIKRLPHDSTELPDVITGRSASSKGKKIRPSHNMWAYRALVLKDGKTGTGQDDYDVQEDQYDDGEKWGGEKILKVLREEGGVDVLVICSRWFGGTMLGPIRFQHILATSQSAINAFHHAETLLSLYSELASLDDLILEYRMELDPLHAPGETPDYSAIKEEEKLERLIKARGRTVRLLVDKVAARGAEELGLEGEEGAEG